MNKIHRLAFATLLSSALGLSTAAAFAKNSDPYYTVDPLLVPAPSSTGKTWPVKDFGPVGIGIDLKRPGMTMEIRSVTEGSPAAQTGKLKKGQIIESINGVVLKDRDPREILGDIITEAEATDGRINLKIKGEGDVLVQIPVIKKETEVLKSRMYRGSWSGRAHPASFNYGPLHASGVHCATFLMMARLCGVDVDQYTFDTALKQFFRYAGRGNVAYGDQLPEDGFRDNGKTSGLAVMLSAATLLTPEGESSVYAKARENSAMKAFYANNWFHAAHTGGGMGEIWHHKAMHLMREKRPIPYRSYLDSRRWVMELSRRHDGTIGIAGMLDRYDKSASEQERGWGTYFALTYTLPRKQLQLFGAPRSKWAKHYPLPERPWGTPADDIFYSMEPVPNPVLTKAHLYHEKAETDSSMRLMQGPMQGPNVAMYLHHPEYGLRVAAMRYIMRAKKHDLILPLLRSDDPRLRHCGVMGIVGPYKGPSLPDSELTSEMVAELVKMVNDPNESWWVVRLATLGLGRAGSDVIEENKDRLLQLVRSDSHWLRIAAISTLSEIAVDRKHVKEVLPAVAFGAANANADWNTAFVTFRDLEKRISQAPDSVKKMAEPIMRQVYNGIPDAYVYPGGARIENGPQAHRTRVARALEKIPGNQPFILQRPKKTVKYMLTGDERDLYTYDGNFKPNPAAIGYWSWVYLGRDSSTADSVEAMKERIKPWVEDWKKKGSKPIKSNYRLRFLEGGEFRGIDWGSRQYPQCIWSGNKMIAKYEDQTFDFVIVEEGGLEFMIISGRLYYDDPDPEEEIEQEWEPSYKLYVKEAGPMARE